MELKRYVLLDNNRIVDREKLDTTNSYGYLMSNILKAIENEEENVCRKSVATSDDITDLIRKDDLILINTGRVIRIRSEEQLRYWKAQNHRIVKLFKPIYKDYICVWEKEESVGL